MLAVQLDNWRSTWPVGILLGPVHCCHLLPLSKRRIRSAKHGVFFVRRPSALKVVQQQKTHRAFLSKIGVSAQLFAISNDGQCSMKVALDASIVRALSENCAILV